MRARTDYGVLGYADGVWIRDKDEGYYELRPVSDRGEIVESSWMVNVRPDAPLLTDDELRVLAQDAWCDAFGAL